MADTGGLEELVAWAVDRWGAYEEPRFRCLIARTLLFAAGEAEERARDNEGRAFEARQLAARLRSLAEAAGEPNP